MPDRPRTGFQSLLTHHLRTFPAVAVLGPRQAGKSTLVRAFLADKGHATKTSFFDLERPADRDRLQRAPDVDLGRLQSRRRFIAIDEVQRMPELFPLLRALLDSADRRARYILLGSASPALMRGVAESLAGRIGFLDLAPFLAAEVGAAEGALRARLLTRGGFPRSFLARSERASLDWRNSYLRALLERDLPALGLDLPPVTLRRLWTMLAHNHGGILNMAELASSLSVSAPTVGRYIDVLEGMYALRRLTPYHANVGKRLVKAPKVYVRDSGVLHALLGIVDHEALLSHPKVGASWEGWVIEQIVGGLHTLGKTPEAFFWRTHGGAEVDLLLRLDGETFPIEIKLGTPSNHRGLIECMKDLKVSRGFVVHGGAGSYPLGHDIWALPAALLARPDQFLNALRRPEKIDS